MAERESDAWNPLAKDLIVWAENWRSSDFIYSKGQVIALPLEMENK
jgi:predicted  nucleic acid-binding Zn ribbon protein